MEKFYNSENDLYITGFCFGIKRKTLFFRVLNREPMLEFWHLFMQLGTPSVFMDFLNCGLNSLMCLGKLYWANLVHIFKQAC